jgi:hypothetical protein
MAQNVVERGGHWLHAASPPFPPPAPDRIYLFRSVKNRGWSHATSGFAKDGEHRLAAMQDSIASQVFPAASKDGFTAVRNK